VLARRRGAEFATPADGLQAMRLEGRELPSKLLERRPVGWSDRPVLIRDDRLHPLKKRLEPLPVAVENLRVLRHVRRRGIP
jgi:hypothetical protein